MRVIVPSYCSSGKELREFNKFQASKNEEIKGEKAFSSELLVRLDMAKLSYKMKYVEAGRYRRELKVRLTVLPG